MIRVGLPEWPHRLDEDRQVVQITLNIVDLLRGIKPRIHTAGPLGDVGPLGAEPAALDPERLHPLPQRQVRLVGGLVAVREAQVGALDARASCSSCSRPPPARRSGRTRARRRDGWPPSRAPAGTGADGRRPARAGGPGGGSGGPARRRGRRRTPPPSAPRRRRRSAAGRRPPPRGAQQVLGALAQRERLERRRQQQQAQRPLSGREVGVLAQPRSRTPRRDGAAGAARCASRSRRRDRSCRHPDADAAARGSGSPRRRSARRRSRSPRRARRAR